jgi:hypothetical protein
LDILGALAESKWRREKEKKRTEQSQAASSSSSIPKHTKKNSLKALLVPSFSVPPMERMGINADTRGEGDGENAEKTNTQKAPFPIEQLFLLFSLQKEEAVSRNSSASAQQFYPLLQIHKSKPFPNHWPTSPKFHKN